MDYGFGLRDGKDNLYYWAIHFDDTELMWTAGGSEMGPGGSDSYTSFQLSLLRGGKDNATGAVDAWYEMHRNISRATSFEIEDNSDEEFWNLNRV